MHNDTSVAKRIEQMPSIHAISQQGNSIDCSMVLDLSVEDYISATASKNPIYMRRITGRYQAKRIRKAQCPIVERLTNSLMMHGRKNDRGMWYLHGVDNFLSLILTEDYDVVKSMVTAYDGFHLYDLRFSSYEQQSHTIMLVMLSAFSTLASTYVYYVEQNGEGFRPANILGDGKTSDHSSRSNAG
ncbi:40S ribosomal protein S5-like protein [Tanacetum coccineum]